MPPDGKRKPLLGKQCIGKEWGNFPSFIEQNILSHTKKSILNAIPREQYPCMPGGMYIPYVPPSSAHFQIGIWSTKRQLFNWQFCVSLHHTICKQWAKGFCEILKFWPLHSVRQNIAGFRRGLFTCFLGHTPLLQYNLLFGPHFCIRGVAQKAGK